MGALALQPMQQNRVARDTNFDLAIRVCEQLDSIGRWLLIRVFSVDFTESAARRFRVCSLTVMVMMPCVASSGESTSSRALPRPQ